jgi:hypothetical protein
MIDKMIDKNLKLFLYLKKQFQLTVVLMKAELRKAKEIN